MKTMYVVVTEDTSGYNEPVYHGAYEDRAQAELVSQDYEASEVITTDDERACYVTTLNVVVTGINLINDQYQIDTTLTPFIICEIDLDDRQDAERRVLEKVQELANQNWGEGNWYGLDLVELESTNPGIWTIR